MNRPALSVLALATVAGATFAGGSEHDWTSLDRELANLSNTLVVADAGLKVNAWLKTNYLHRDEDTGPDTSGFQISGARLTFSSDVAPNYKVKISIDGGSGTVGLRDAIGTWKMSENCSLHMGNFKSPFLFSAVSSDEKLLFHFRTTQGAVWGGREPGAMVEGAVENFRAYLAVHNGGDGVLDEFLVTGKVAWDLVAGKPFTKQEGGYGPDSDTLLSVGLGIVDEGTLSNGTVIGAEAQLATGAFFAMGEIVDYDEDFVAGAVTAGNARLASGRADTTPFGVQAGFQINPNWEVIARFEDQDDSDDTSAIGGGVNYYVKGHDAKWQFSVVATDSDDPAVDGEAILLGLVVVI